MKKELNPIVLISAGVAAAVLLIIFAVYTLAPHPPQVTIPPPDQQNEGAMKRRNILKQQGQSPGAETPEAGAAKSTGE